MMDALRLQVLIEAMLSPAEAVELMRSVRADSMRADPAAASERAASARSARSAKFEQATGMQAQACRHAGMQAGSR